MRSEAPAWTTVTLAVFVGALAGAGLGWSRQPLWEAQAELAVGGAQVTIAELPGYVTSSNALAASYSRMIVATEVVTATAEDTGLTPAEVRSSLVASPIADSPVIRVRATGATEKSAVQLANSGAQALLRFVSDVEVSNTTAESLLEQIETLSRELDGAVREQERAVDTITRERERDQPRTAVLDRAFQARGEAAAKASLLETRIAALRELYTRDVRARSAGFGVYPIVTASSATNDRVQRTQIYGLLGGAGGGLAAMLGIALRSLVRPRR